MYWLAYSAGALVATFLISRLFLWIFKRMGDTPRRLVVAYLVAWLVAMGLNWGGALNNPVFDPIEVFVPHTVALLFWLGVDWLRFKRRRAKAQTVSTFEAGA